MPHLMDLTGDSITNVKICAVRTLKNIVTSRPHFQNKESESELYLAQQGLNSNFSLSKTWKYHETAGKGHRSRCTTTSWRYGLCLLAHFSLQIVFVKLSGFLLIFRVAHWRRRRRVVCSPMSGRDRAQFARRFPLLLINGRKHGKTGKKEIHNKKLGSNCQTDKSRPCALPRSIGCKTERNGSGFLFVQKFLFGPVGSNSKQ